MPFRFEKLTIKAQEAVQRAQELAADAGNPQIEPVHLLAALLGESDGLVRPVLEKMGANVAQLDLTCFGFFGVGANRRRTLEQLTGHVSRYRRLWVPSLAHLHTTPRKVEGSLGDDLGLHRGAATYKLRAMTTEDGFTEVLSDAACQHRICRTTVATRRLQELEGQALTISPVPGRVVFTICH